jgi:thiol:disulfide interchange protein DsbD
MKFLLTVLVLALTYSNSSFAQTVLFSPIEWSAKVLQKKAKGTVQLTAKLQPGWHVFSQFQSSKGPTATHIQFVPSPAYQLVGKTSEPASITYYEKLFKADVKYFENEVSFHQNLQWAKKPVPIKVKIEYMVCSAKECLPPDEIELDIVPKA